MATIPGSIPYTGFIAPTDSADTFPVTKPEFGLGSLRTVADITARDAITSQRREEGMLVYVVSESAYYKLEGGITNSDWNIAEYITDTIASTLSTTDVFFDRRRIYDTSTAAATGDVTGDVTGAKLGMIQKIYHEDTTIPDFPATWVPIGIGTYQTNELNIIYAEFCGGTRVEYWIAQEQ